MIDGPHIYLHENVILFISLILCSKIEIKFGVVYIHTIEKSYLRDFLSVFGTVLHIMFLFVIWGSKLNSLFDICCVCIGIFY